MRSDQTYTDVFRRLTREGTIPPGPIHIHGGIATHVSIPPGFSDYHEMATRMGAWWGSIRVRFA